MSNYAICCKGSTFIQWQEVIITLVTKHIQISPIVLTYTTSIYELQHLLSHVLPYFTCFVSPPTECNKEYVKDVLKLTRSLEPDGFCSTIWGILTGSDLQCALNIAKHQAPITIERVLSNCPFPINKCISGTSYSEINKNCCTCKPSDSIQPIEKPCTDNLAKYLHEDLSNEKIDLLITSAHASEHDWRIGYQFDGGKFIDTKNQLFAKYTDGSIHQVSSTHPKVYIAAGNCLMGSILPDSCMALSWLNSCSIMQMVGYTVPTWFGYGGWGVLKYFIEMSGKYSLSEAFFSNLQTMLYCIQDNKDPNIVKGCLHDSEVIAFYGDPALDSRLQLPKEGVTLSHKYELTVASKTPWIIKVKTNSSGSWDCDEGDDKATDPGRPPIYVFPRRLKKWNILKGNVMVTSMFALFKLFGKFAKDEEYEAIIEEIA